MAARFDWKLIRPVGDSLNRIPAILLAIALSSSMEARAADPFSVSAKLNTTKDGQTLVSVSFSIPAGHHVYADTIKVECTDGRQLTPYDIPKPELKKDQSSDSDTNVYEHDVTFVYAVHGDATPPIAVEAHYQGCSGTLCLRPAIKKFSVGGGAAVEIVKPDRNMSSIATNEHASNWQKIATNFTFTGSASGYLGPQDFIKFIDQAKKGGPPSHDRLRSVFEHKGLLVAGLLIVIFGLALNLTPCILPMIPINIAIIGAGTRAGSRRHGFALGSAYGAGIAAFYGAMGLAVVLAGSRFGTLNASPLFNIGMAIVFFFMSLAMFGVFNIDFSRFQTAGSTNRQGGFMFAFVAGGVAALLAGACVAPALISVLLLSADLYSRGSSVALLLPFLLGFGMALPWPFVGAGLSFLPRPGKWMERVKYGFGVIILALALWYGQEGYSLLKARSDSSRAEVAAAQTEGEAAGWLTSLDAALLLAEQQHKPVFVDLWASWCKNCLAMDGITFKDPEVKKRLVEFVKVKCRAEDLNDPATKEILDHFHVVGLPTYLVLLPGITAYGQAGERDVESSEPMENPK
jgi:thiol:disulfide interchange protein